MDFRDTIAQAVMKATGRDLPSLREAIEVPPEASMGDFALPMFILAKELKKSPPQIASEVAEQINSDDMTAEAAGPYLNITFSPEQKMAVIAQGTMPQAGSASKTVMVEFSQPNTHKEFHVGHLRNACLGDALVRILRAAGQTVIPVNYLGDIGTHIAECLWCLQTYHTDEEPQGNKGQWLGSIYVEAKRRVAEQPEAKEEVSKLLQALEAREPEIAALWQKTREWSLDAFKEIYADLGIVFDAWFFESEEDEPGKKIAMEILDQGIAEKSEGAIIVNLEDQNMGVALILKSDGTTLYLTKDLSLAQRKFNEYNIDESYYVVDSRQKLHLQQAFAILRKMGFDKNMVHLAYEFVSTKDGPISSRTGNTFLYGDLRDRMEQVVRAETVKRHPDWSEEQVSKVAHSVTLGALKFGMLKMDSNREIIFDEDSWLDLSGETGPYVQYTHARICSLEAKAGDLGQVDYAALSSVEDRALMRLLLATPSLVLDAARQHKPHMVARHVLDLAQCVNEYYHKHQVLQAEPAVGAARLELLKAARNQVALLCDLLGISCPQQM